MRVLLKNNMQKMMGDEINESPASLDIFWCHCGSFVFDVSRLFYFLVVLQFLTMRVTVFFIVSLWTYFRCFHLNCLGLLSELLNI